VTNRRETTVHYVGEIVEITMSGLSHVGLDEGATLRAPIVERIAEAGSARKAAAGFRPLRRRSGE
jgi:hypothetical protein